VAALQSDDPWKRYWGCIVCSTYKKQAESLMPVIQDIEKNDPVLMNRVRAAEYLGISGNGNPVPSITNSLYACTDGVEALLLLNTVVLLQDGFGYTFNFDANKIKEEVRSNSHVVRRLEYLQVL
jgi:hypothetical protein